MQIDLSDNNLSLEGVMKIVAWITSLSAEEMARETPLTIALQNNSRMDKQDVDRVVQVLRSGVCLHEEFKYSCRAGMGNELNHDRVVLVYGHSRGPLGRSMMMQSTPLFPKIEASSTWQPSAPSSAATRLLIQINMGVVEEVSAGTERMPSIHSPRTATVDPWMSVVSAVESIMEEELYPRDKLLRTI